MARYIDADKFEQAIKGKEYIPNSFHNTFIYNELHRQPAADVVEVKHGEWVRKEDEHTYWFACSVCEERIGRTRWGEDNYSNYCPNCGAKMDVERSET